MHGTAAVLDVSDRSATIAFFAGEPPFDILVNNAGTNRPKPMTEVSEEQLAVIAIEAFDSGRPLCGGAAVDEALVGQFDSAAGAGVLAGSERLRPAVGVGEVEDHQP